MRITRFLLLLLLITVCLKGNTQRYNRVIKDTAIINFMAWLFKSDTAFTGIRHVDNDIRSFPAGNLVFPDSLQLKDYQYATNIFQPKNKLAAYIKKEDAAYFLSQVNTQRKTKWQLKIKGIRLYDTIEMANNRVDKVLYSYSLPVFSKDNRYVIIVQAFFCGLVCGGGEYNLFERQADNTWRLLRAFNQWEE
jgi:hypothetical protein